MTKILIVENEPIVADALSQFLHYAGYQVVGIAKDEASAHQDPDTRAVTKTTLAGRSACIFRAVSMPSLHPASRMSIKTRSGCPAAACLSVLATTPKM